MSASCEVCIVSKAHQCVAGNIVAVLLLKSKVAHRPAKSIAHISGRPKAALLAFEQARRRPLWQKAKYSALFRRRIWKPRGLFISSRPYMSIGVRLKTALSPEASNISEHQRRQEINSAHIGGGMTRRRKAHRCRMALSKMSCA